jgi:iron complex outermembrane receptor protein
MPKRQAPDGWLLPDAIFADDITRVADSNTRKLAVAGSLACEWTESGEAFERRRRGTAESGRGFGEAANFGNDWGFCMKQLTSRRALLLCATVLAGLAASPSLAETMAAGSGSSDSGSSGSGSVAIGEIVVTATRRSTTLQNAPINISAVTSEAIQNQRIDDVRSLAAFTPGVTVADTGPSSTGNIILRGIASGDTGGGANSNNAVGVYLGEVPLYLDFKLVDIDRVEVLQGPQGTLYGLGTLAGAMRYIPNRPVLDRYSVDVDARVFKESHSAQTGGIGNVTVNLPIMEDKIALRSVIGYYDNPGFIDYNHLLKAPGVSNPQPVLATATTPGSFGTPADYAANYTSKKGVNFEHTFTTRNQLLVEFTPELKAYLTYAHQDTSTGGRQSNGAGVLGTPKYEGPWRYLEPSHRTADLYSMEFQAALGHFAEFYSTTSYTNQTIKTKSDNTDLLLDLDYGYQAFPSFSSWAENHSHNKQFNQEFRLLSTHGGPVTWVLGAFYNRLTTASDRKEYTPGYSAWAGINRPDDLEYISAVNSKTAEKAVYGEITYQVTNTWQVTGGFRYFDYNAQVRGGADIPLTRGGLRRMPYPSTTIAASRFRSGTTSGDGLVWKANTSYQFTPNLLGYFTYSTGYRVGGVNRVVPCALPLPPGQNLCALPNELSYQPDRTKNMEVGLRAALFDRRLQMTIDAYKVDWTSVQVPSVTVNGSLGVILNGAAAVSQGVDFSASFRVTSQLQLAATYAYDDAHLTQDVPGLEVSHGVRYDAFAGDRLPGSTRNSGSIQAIYTYPLEGDRDVQAVWGTTFTGDIYSRVGRRGFGTDIPGYSMSRASITYRTKSYDIGIFADNIFDTYAVTSVSNDLSSLNLSRTGVTERFYSQSVLTPRQIGVQLRYRFN